MRHAHHSSKTVNLQPGGLPHGSASSVRKRIPGASRNHPLAQAGGRKFRAMFEEYHQLDDEICRIEEDVEYATDQQIDELKFKRAKLQGRALRRRAKTRGGTGPLNLSCSGHAREAARARLRSPANGSISIPIGQSAGRGLPASAGGQFVRILNAHHGCRGSAFRLAASAMTFSAASRGISS